MKSKKLWVLLALFCIVCGAILCGAGFGLGGVLHDSYGVHYGKDRVGIFVDDNDYDDITDTLALQDFSSLRMDIALGEIHVQRGNRLELLVENAAKEDYDVRIEGDTLIITYDPDLDFHLFDLDFWDDYDIEFTLILPYDMDLKYAEITSHMGDVKVSNGKIETLEIYQNMGDIKVENVYSESMTLDQDMGDIEYKGQHPGNMNIHNDMGDIEVEIQDNREKYAYDLTASMGSIEVNHRKQEGMSTSLSGGDHHAPYQLTMHNNMGDIELEFDYD